MYNLSVKPEEKIVFKLFQFISLRIRFVLAVRTFLRLCCVLLSSFLIYALHKLFFLGDSWLNVQSLYCLLFALILLLPISFVIVLVIKISLKPLVEKVDSHLALDDRLNASYEIVQRKYKRGDWTRSILTDTSSKLSCLSLKISSVFPLKCKGFIIAIIFFICFFAFIQFFAQSEINRKWKEYRFRHYLLINSQKIIDYSDELLRNEQHFPIVKILQKTAVSIEKTARNISKTGIRPTKENVFNILENTSEKVENVSEKDIIINDKLFLNKIKNHLVKFENGLSNYTPQENFASDVAGNGSGKKGVGKYKGLPEKEIGENRILTADRSSEKIELIKQGNFEKTAANESIGKMFFSEDFEGDISVVKTSKYEGSVYPDKLNHSRYNKNKQTKLFRVNGDITLNPVWIDSIPPNRRDCVKNYFSVSRKIRSFHNGE